MEQDKIKAVDAAIRTEIENIGYDGIVAKYGGLLNARAAISKKLKEGYIETPKSKKTSFAWDEDDMATSTSHVWATETIQDINAKPESKSVSGGIMEEIKKSSDRFNNAFYEASNYTQIKSNGTTFRTNIKFHDFDFNDTGGYHDEPKIVNNKLPDTHCYRTVLSPDKTNIIYVSCPKTFTGGYDELMAKFNENNRDFRQLDSIPNNNTPAFKTNSFKPSLRKGIRVPSSPVVRNNVTAVEFNRINDKLFTYSLGNSYTNDTPISRDRYRTRYQRMDPTYRVPVLYTDYQGVRYHGLTTGRINHSNGTAEIVAVMMHPSNGHYLEKTFSKMDVDYALLTPLSSTAGSKFFILKVLAVEESSRLFGFKTQKTKMLNRVFDHTEFIVERSFFSKKEDRTIDVVEIKCEDGRWLKFLMSEVEFLTIDTDRVGERIDRTIKKGVKVKIVDDRKIKLERNQQVVVDSIYLNKNCYKKSLANVYDDAGVKHTVFFKQIKIV